MEFLMGENFIIVISIILLISFGLGELSKKTSIPSVLMLIVLGMICKVTLESFHIEIPSLLDVLSILGTVGLIMIVLEAALELKLEKENLIPICKAFAIALIGLVLSAWVAAEIIEHLIFDPVVKTAGMSDDAFHALQSQNTLMSWIYATPLSILSSAIIIPSVVDLRQDKKEFHIYESTFSDILGIMLFYFLTSQLGGHGEEAHGGGSSILNFGLTTLLTLVIAVISSYAIIVIFQNIKSHVKLFLLIAVLLLLYAVGKKLHLSSLIIILIFGLMISNMQLFFSGFMKNFLRKDQAKEIYHGLHVITMETAFVIRTLFFVIFGITIQFGDLSNLAVAGISLLILASIYIIRFVLIRSSIGSDMNPQLWIAPRGLITVLLYYKILDPEYVPEELQNGAFNMGYLLYIIIGSGIIMTIAMIYDKRRSSTAINKANKLAVDEVKWKTPQV